MFVCILSGDVVGRDAAGGVELGVGRGIRLLGAQHEARAAVGQHLILEQAELVERLVGVDAGDAQAAQLRDRVLDVGAVAVFADKDLQLIDDQRIGVAGLVGAGPRKCRAYELLQQQHAHRAGQIA